MNWTRPYSSARARAIDFASKRLARARDAFEQDVALRDQRDRAQADRLLLADDGFDELLSQARVELRRGDRSGAGHHATLSDG